MSGNPTQRYQTGFGNEFATEAMDFALPLKGNSPQKPLHGLYAEQISGTTFTAPRESNRRTWMYRIRPSVMHEPFALYTHRTLIGPPFNPQPVSPNQMRWDAPQIPKKPVDFFDSFFTMAGAGDTASGTGLAIHTYAATATRRNRYFYNADGEMLFLPEQGTVSFRTEMGVLDVAPGEIAVIPRGVKFSVTLPDTIARGYICENYGVPFTLPELGPIGADGLAYPRHFLYPVAAFEDKTGEFELLAKFDNTVWQAKIGHSPLDVVAWHGNYAPYKYNLDNFMTIGSVSYDHVDPSVFTVLTSPSYTRDVGSNVDFVIFPPRWSVAENTFRLPWFHRNMMSEFMGLIRGNYEAKEGGGFEPGGASLHNCMSAHGPDVTAWEKGANEKLEPQKVEGALAFMFESRYVFRPTVQALATGLQPGYANVWQGFPKNFKSV
jgi:homogentisate 1,2-dioxygenase